MSLKRTGPVAVGTSAADAYAVPGLEELREISVCNKTSSPVLFETWIAASAGATTAGTELIQKSIAARDTYVYPFDVKLTSADHIVCRADTTTALTVTITTKPVGI